MDDLVAITQVLGNITLTIVVPLLALLAKRLFDQQLEIVKSRAEFMRETQFDRTLALIEAQKKVYENERTQLLSQIDSLSNKGASAESELLSAKERVESLTRLVEAFSSSAAEISRELALKNMFAADVSLRGWTVPAKIDFRGVVFSELVDFSEARFEGGVHFYYADLRKGKFEGASLRGVDLSKASIDADTKNPKVRWMSGVKW